MLNAFGVAARGFGAYPQRQQERFHDLTAHAAFVGQRLPLGGQKDTAVGLLLYQSRRDQPLKHLGHRRLRNTQPRSQINLARFTAIADQIGN